MIDLFSIPQQAFGWAGPWVFLTYVGIHLLKTRTRMKELQDSADGSLRKDLMSRIDALEQQLRDERAECTRRIEALEQLAYGPGSASTFRQARLEG